MLNSSSSLRDPQLSIVVPAFNEEAGIGDCINRLRAYLDRTGVFWEIIVVDDGSSDDTAAVVARASALDGRVQLVAGGRRGKGGAISRGMREARGAWRFMADADLSMPPENIARFFAVLREAAVTPHVVIGSREAPGARRIGEAWTRHVIGRVFNLIVQMVAVPGISDTQCGFKLFSAEAVRTLFPCLTIHSFAFDVELLFLTRRAGASVQEVGIEWHCRRNSRVDAGRGAQAFLDVVRVRWNAARGRYRGLQTLTTAPPKCEVDGVCC